MAGIWVVKIQNLLHFSTHHFPQNTKFARKSGKISTLKSKYEWLDHLINQCITYWLSCEGIRLGFLVIAIEMIMPMVLYKSKYNISWNIQFLIIKLPFNNSSNFWYLLLTRNMTHRKRKFYRSHLNFLEAWRWNKLKKIAQRGERPVHFGVVHATTSASGAMKIEYRQHISGSMEVHVQGLLVHTQYVTPFSFIKVKFDHQKTVITY